MIKLGNPKLHQSNNFRTLRPILGTFKFIQLMRICFDYNEKCKMGFKYFRAVSQFVLHDGSPLRERSAEATALQLLLSLKNPHQPKASELRFLVSEQDAPQKVKNCFFNHNQSVSNSHISTIGLRPTCCWLGLGSTCIGYHN